ncbi:CBS domain-containing protein [Streptomyces sp. NBC_00038]|uniref:CBS domain-containing protein n=1 Tax=Streptomyces sp. NBC_00038 TaxID=2903615 RepID=UPI00225C16EB|nr:CBS domain-containing protein [Streptomyces sp. NBC_00038]MCX5554689.1 CBS domain-containing protein [Streptomyces sp. NBC_00038]
MKHTKIGALMVADVVTARYETPFKDVARLLGEHRVSGLPVVDKDGKVMGVISETDLMVRQAETSEPYGPKRHFRFAELTRGARRQAAKAHARTAGQLMTEPPVTVHADDTVAEAARTMALHHVERLPVVDEEARLVGIVTRGDLLQVFLRTDDEIQADVVKGVVVDSLWLAPQTIGVDVHDGVVTLNGQLERLSEKHVALRMTSQLDGVVGVVDQLSYRIDDSHLKPAEQALHGVADDWLRKL